MVTVTGWGIYPKIYPPKQVTLAGLRMFHPTLEFSADCLGGEDGTIPAILMCSFDITEALS